MPTATGFRDRRIHSLAVGCPTCGAEPESTCVSAAGKRANHPARRRMAIRALNATGQMTAGTNLRVVQHMSFADRRAIRSAAGLSRQEVAESVGTYYAQVRNWELTRQPTCEAGVRYADLLIELRGDS